MKLILAILLAIFATYAEAATTQLPPGQQCFTDINGPITSGSVNMFVPNSTTPKQTWQDAGQVTPNTQPIQLDQNGCATIYGIGTYRQQVFDGPVINGVTTGNLIFDKLTTDTSATNNVFWAGQATGTPNSIIVTDPGFNGTDGSIVNLIAASTNTGATVITLSPTSFTNVPIVKDTTNGPVALVGGEIIGVSGGTANIISLLYSASQGNFHLLNTAIASASGSTAPICGAVGLKITNGSTPNSIISLTASQAITVNPAGLVLNRSGISLTNINITTGTSTSTANGMDGEATGTNAWLYIWIIDNGIAPAGLVSAASGNSLNPTLPTGYTYKCRVGAMRVDGSSNLLRTIQVGPISQYQVTAATNTAAFPNIANGTAGTFSLTAPTWATVSVANFVPTTATMLKFIAVTQWNNAALANVEVAPANTSVSGPQTTNPPMITVFGANSAPPTLMGEYVLETQNIVWASSAAGGAISAVGWRDAVNAN